MNPHGHVHVQWHLRSDCPSGDRAVPQAAETHLNSSEKGEKRYLFVPCLKEGKKDFSHVNEGRVAVFCVMRFYASKTCSRGKMRFATGGSQHNHAICFASDKKENRKY